MVRVHHSILQYVVRLPVTEIQQLNQGRSFHLLDPHRRRDQCDHPCVPGQRSRLVRAHGLRVYNAGDS